MCYHLYFKVFDSTAFRYSFYGIVGVLKVISTSAQAMLYKYIEKLEKREKTTQNGERGALIGNAGVFKGDTHTIRNSKETDI